MANWTVAGAVDGEELKEMIVLEVFNDFLPLFERILAVWAVDDLKESIF
jgi:hypothetical protein